MEIIFDDSLRIKGKKYKPEDIIWLNSTDTIEELLKILNQGFEVLIKWK